MSDEHDTHGADGTPWYGFDLDGTLAEYHGWKGVEHIGKPIKPMCDLMKRLHAEGKRVKILFVQRCLVLFKRHFLGYLLLLVLMLM